MNIENVEMSKDKVLTITFKQGFFAKLFNFKPKTMVFGNRRSGEYDVKTGKDLTYDQSIVRILALRMLSHRLDKKIEFMQALPRGNDKLEEELKKERMAVSALIGGEWKIDACHPIAARVLKLGLTHTQALMLKDELEENGYEDIIMEAMA